MILTNTVKRFFQPKTPRGIRPLPVEPNQKRVLNVGGSSKQIPIPDYFAGWAHLLLDVDPAGAPDIVCDARNLEQLQADFFDAVYCSHNLEHYYKHHGLMVLRGFLHVLKPDGFADIRVPDMKSVMLRVAETGLDIEDTLYDSAGGPISVRDVIYGWGKQIEASGVDFYAHKTGFTAQSLAATLSAAGFGQVMVAQMPELFELRALAFKSAPSLAQRALLGLTEVDMGHSIESTKSTTHGNI